MVSLQKLEQGRAAYAFDEIDRHIKNQRISDDLLRSYIKKMPSMIQINGLGQTIAFYYSKRSGKKEGIVYDAIYHTIQTWLKTKFPDYFKEHQELVQAVINVHSSEYRLLTVETLALLNWMKKFVDGMVQKNGDDH